MTHIEDYHAFGFRNDKLNFQGIRFDVSVWWYQLLYQPCAYYPDISTLGLEKF